MKKITFVRRQHTPYGGAERYLERLIKVLESLDYEIEILHEEQPKWMPSWLKFIYYDYRVCKMKKERFYFSNDRLSCLDIYRAGGGVHKVFLKSKGFTLNPLHVVYLWLEKKTFENAITIIANSKMVKKEIMTSYGIPSEKIKVVYNGVPLYDFNKEMARKKIQKEFDLLCSEKIILYVGSGFQRKGVKEFLQVVSLLEGEYKAFVIGKEKKMSLYKKIAKKLEIDQKVVFTDVRKDVDIFYAAADIFLFPTRYEPFSNVVLEALSYGNIVFTTKQNGASEILDPYYVLSSPTDTKVVEKIEELLRDDHLLKREQHKARKVAEQYPIELNADKTIDVVKDVFRKIKLKNVDSTR